MTRVIHHLNCATMRPVSSFGGRVTPTSMVAHVLVVEGNDALTLVDTGFGTEDLRTQRMGKPFIRLMGAALDPAETALAQVQALGFRPDDVRDVVLTHLDLDHAGGLGDFPGARVHVYSAELAAATSPASLKEKNRYLSAQWSHRPQWETHEVAGDEWLGFGSVRAVGEDVLMIPLHGHTRGHCGVAVRRPGGAWLLHAGDSYFSAGEVETPPTCPPGLSAFQGLVEMDRAARLGNQERLRELHASHGPTSGAEEIVTIFSAHDASEFEALAAREA